MNVETETMSDRRCPTPGSSAMDTRALHEFQRMQLGSSRRRVHRA